MNFFSFFPTCYKGKNKKKRLFAQCASSSTLYFFLFIFLSSISLTTFGIIKNTVKVFCEFFFSKLPMSSTTLTSFASSKANSKELCCICKSQPYDLICTCGDKFDFNCIQEHVEYLGVVFQDEFQKASDHLEQLTVLKSKENTGTGTTRALIEDWVYIHVFLSLNIRVIFCF